MADAAVSLTWANSAPITTRQQVVVPDAGYVFGQLPVHCFNPGAVAITVRPGLQWVDKNGVTRTSDLSGETFTVAAGATVCKLVNGIGAGTPVVAATNDVAVGAAGTFTAQFLIEFP